MDAHRLTETGKRLYKRRKEAEERSFADVKELHGHRYIRFPECGEGAGSGVAGGGLPEHGEDGAPAGAPSALLGEAILLFKNRLGTLPSRLLLQSVFQYVRAKSGKDKPRLQKKTGFVRSLKGREPRFLLVACYFYFAGLTVFRPSASHSCMPPRYHLILSAG